MKNYSLADKLRFINESENEIDREAFDSMLGALHDCISVCQDGDKLKRFIQNHPNRAIDIMDMLGIVLFIAANPERINRIKFDNPNTANMRYLGKNGWEQIRREFLQATEDLDENGVKVLKRAFTRAKLLD